VRHSKCVCQSAVAVLYRACRERCPSQLGHGVDKRLCDILLVVGKPLSGQCWPVQSSAQNHVVEERRIFLPRLVLFVDNLVLGLLIILFRRAIAHYLVSKDRIRYLACAMRTVVVVFGHRCDGGRWLKEGTGEIREYETGSLVVVIDKGRYLWGPQVVLSTAQLFLSRLLATRLRVEAKWKTWHFGPCTRPVLA
jgi:hypothetical protein